MELPTNMSQQTRPRITIHDTTEVVCDKCAHNVFNMGVFMRKVSPLISGTGTTSYVPIENVACYCVKCGHVNNEFLPTELKSKSIVS